MEAAWQAGFRNYEGAMGGYGGCPMTGYELLGNLDTYNLVTWSEQNGIEIGLDKEALENARVLAGKIFS